MRRISHETYGQVFGVVYLGLMTNLLLLVVTLPLLVLLVTTDPARSWPLLAIVSALVAPAMTAAFTVFREHMHGSTTVARDFVSGLRSTWWRALAVGAATAALSVVLLVDIRAMSGTAFAVVAIPALGVLQLLAVAVSLHTLVALGEHPGARLATSIRASVYLSVRRWYLSLASLAVLAVQAVLFTSAPALAIGVTASGGLYLAWANSRRTLQPLLDTTLAP